GDLAEVPGGGAARAARLRRPRRRGARQRARRRLDLTRAAVGGLPRAPRAAERGGGRPPGALFRELRKTLFHSLLVYRFEEFIPARADAPLARGGLEVPAGEPAASRRDRAPAGGRARRRRRRRGGGGRLFVLASTRAFPVIPGKAQYRGGDRARQPERLGRAARDLIVNVGEPQPSACTIVRSSERSERRRR